MIGKILILAILMLGAIIGYEYYFGNYNINLSNFNLHLTPNSTVIVRTTTTVITEKPNMTILHYYNFSTELSVFSNTSGEYIYPISLPSFGNVTLNIVSSSTLHLKIYNGSSLLNSYTGTSFHKTFYSDSTLRIYFLNFSGEAIISLNETY